MLGSVDDKLSLGETRVLCSSNFSCIHPIVLFKRFKSNYIIVKLKKELHMFIFCFNQSLFYDQIYKYNSVHNGSLANL